MKEFEIVEFYPLRTKNPKFFGTLHVFVNQQPKPYDIRGIRVFRNSHNSFWFAMPSDKAIDAETGEIVCFPVWSFLDEKDKLNFESFLKNQGAEYVRQYLAKSKGTNPPLERGQHKSALGNKETAKKGK